VYCVTHQEELWVKSLNETPVVDTADKTLNFINGSALNSREFVQFMAINIK
jgi:hypothetical protein